MTENSMIKLNVYSEMINEELKKFAAEKPALRENICEAMDYSLTAGGKRLRPILMLEFCRMCGGNASGLMKTACSIELIHTFSLIHDDLPCMDDDDYRRGKPSCHKAYGEATALLAGDALNTLAFEAIADAATEGVISAQTAIMLVSVLAKAVGVNGMIGGQVLDMGAEHRKISLDELRLLQKLKTGCLLRAACELGCAAAGATDEDTIARARAYGEKLGLAFQIEDDILDIEGDAATLGKSIGKDAASEKSTFPSLLGLEECRELAAKLTEEAVDAVKPLDGHAFLVELARSLTGRTK